MPYDSCILASHARDYPVLAWEIVVAGARLGAELDMSCKLVILALLCGAGIGEEIQEEKIVENVGQQLLKFTIPLGWGAGELLEEEDPALR